MWRFLSLCFHSFSASDIELRLEPDKRHVETKELRESTIKRVTPMMTMTRRKRITCMNDGV